MSQDHSADRQAQLDRARAIAQYPGRYSALVDWLVYWAEERPSSRGSLTGALSRTLVREGYTGRGKLARRIQRAAGR